MSFVNYRNGNYVVYFNTETGDKIRNTKANRYEPAFAENCDVTITEYCDAGCSFCYVGCSKKGKHGKLNAKFLDSIHPFTELAINGNDLSHPDLVAFLTKMRDRHVIVNMTVNQVHFEKHFDKILNWQSQGLIKGVGVSFSKPSDTFLDKVKLCKNVVVHVIEGILTENDVKYLADRDIHLLVLGYKTTGRGADYLNYRGAECMANSLWLKHNLHYVFSCFQSVSFDNLALERLNVRGAVSEDCWSRHFMGNDGDFTFFINLVHGYFAKNSTSAVHYPLMDSVEEMFAVIKNEKE